MTFECTVDNVGEAGSATVWSGSAFDCDSAHHEIVLLHSRFNESSEYIRTCNNGTVVGWSLGDANGTYTAQLNVTIKPEIIGQRIRCSLDSSSPDVIGDYTIYNHTSGISRHALSLSLNPSFL